MNEVTTEYEAKDVLKFCKTKKKSECAKIIDDYYKQITKIIDDEKKELLKDEIKKLENIIGQDIIKEKMAKLINYIAFYNKTKKELNLQKPKLNFAFIGNSGTGKTTIARIIARILYLSGYSEKKDFLETTATSLIGEYVGQTGPKTRNLIDKYKGGVIFIDEAYSLSKKGEESSSYVNDALVEILKGMEENTTFIFAGYKEEMDGFLNLNPGLKSRLFDIYNFEDYSEEELIKMLTNKFKKSNIVIEKSAKDIIKENIVAAKKDKNFGNGRYVESLFNKILINHATYVKDCDDMDVIKLITKESIPLYEGINKSLVGF